MILYCVRHGETLFNAEGRIQGQLDTPLSELGRRQGQAVIRTLCELPLGAVAASPLARAHGTAAELAAACGAPLVVDPRLMEINAGTFQGRTWPEIDETYPAEARGWRSHDPDYRIPGGESRRDLMQRAYAAFEAIRALGHDHVAVVAHGGILGAALKALLGIPAERNPFSLLNGSITRVAWSSEVKLLSLNDVGHLNGARGGGGDL